MHYVPNCNKITHLAKVLQNIHAFTRDQGSDIFDVSSYSLYLSPIDTDFSIVTRHVGRMSNIKEKSVLKGLLQGMGN